MKINNTAKCVKCLTCGNYQYVCQGETNYNKAEKCEKYEYDENAYHMQDRDDTYIKSSDILNEEFDKSVKHYNQYKTKVYLFDYDTLNDIITCYSTHIPSKNETMVVYKDGILTKYEVKDRCLCVNYENDNSVWNLYVSEVKKL